MENQPHTGEEYGKNLPDFPNEFTAIAFYYDYRNDQLDLLLDIAGYFDVKLNFEPDSLINLESLYFHLFRTNGLFDFQLTLEEFESCMSVYFGEIVVRHLKNADWVVSKYPYAEEKYAMGLRRGRFTDYFSNLFEQHYLAAKDELQMMIYQRFLRMKKRAELK
ncbi:hypothetical protein LRR81_10435 [Metabacillus sp. GX 13764]|uniref:hypothetical protein n=1 Tax=Metabacillus kandeliae TaxID=2900151 RepID=UPI001E3C4224|nr:hypothetical protein [Metabacillus kandeliae]MCD7034659.1 hypothetical protein [Metabacillus kandeliae]